MNKQFNKIVINRKKKSKFCINKLQGMKCKITINKFKKKITLIKVRN